MRADGGDPAEAGYAAFAQWYASDERREIYYAASCSAYLDEQDTSHAIPQYGALAEDYFDRLCTLPDGRDFPCAEPELPAR